MPQLFDLSVVRAHLNREREWAAYAIGDLSPGLVDKCEWRVSADGESALLLVYHGFDPPIAFAMGDPGHLRLLFDEVRSPRISLQLRPDAVNAIADIYAPLYTRHMCRMVLQAGKFRPASQEGVRSVGEEDLAAVSALYEDGHTTGEDPTFFRAAMLRQNTFWGVWENGALVSIAGTHLYSPAFGICAIGNVYTRSDCRGRGLGARVTSAVVAQAIEGGVATIVLNVAQANATARRVYERLGFNAYCDFVEGEATRASDIGHPDSGAAAPGFHQHEHDGSSDNRH